MNADSLPTKTVVLKPCPFCGGPVEIERTTGRYEEMHGRRQWWGVVCRNNRNVGGSCAIQQIPSASEETAVARWNTRAKQPDEPAGDVVTAMLDYNQMLRSFAMIASRNGEQTRWEGLYDQIHALLAKHHDTWKRYFPPMQPDDEGSIFHQCLVPIQPETKAAVPSDACACAEYWPGQPHHPECPTLRQPANGGGK